jgi:hypothetical protein
MTIYIHNSQLKHHQAPHHRSAESYRSKRIDFSTVCVDFTGEKLKNNTNQEIFGLQDLFSRSRTL